MLKSSFQFTNPVLTTMKYCINENFKFSGELKVPIKFSISNNYTSKSLSSKVDLSVFIGEESDKYPYFISATMSSYFKWENGKYSEADLNFLLTQNAPALLLSYLRPVIANITNVSPYLAYNIPFFDFTQNPESKNQD